MSDEVDQSGELKKHQSKGGKGIIVTRLHQPRLGCGARENLGHHRREINGWGHSFSGVFVGGNRGKKGKKGQRHLGKMPPGARRRNGEVTRDASVRTRREGGEPPGSRTRVLYMSGEEVRHVSVGRVCPEQGGGPSFQRRARANHRHDIGPWGKVARELFGKGNRGSEG